MPDEVIDGLKNRAREQGLSLSAYALRVLSRDADRPALREVLSLPPLGDGRITGQRVVEMRIATTFLGDRGAVPTAPLPEALSPAAPA